MSERTRDGLAAALGLTRPTIYRYLDQPENIENRCRMELPWPCFECPRFGESADRGHASPIDSRATYRWVTGSALSHRCWRNDELTHDVALYWLYSNCFRQVPWVQTIS